MITIDCYVGSELNQSRIEISQGGAVVGAAWMALVTRVVLAFGGLTIDTSTDTSGSIDFTSSAADSIIEFELGRFVTSGNSPGAGYHPARLDIYHGSDNAVIAHPDRLDLRVRVMA